MDVTALVSRPLEGTTVRALGDSIALRVAVARLRALGCVVETEAPSSDAPAGWLIVTEAPFAPAGGALPECRIGWSGPVAVPMACERDVQAACGIMQVHGRATGGPRALGVPFASICAGVFAAQAITAGMLALLRGGTAVAAVTSVAQAALLALTQYVAVATTGANPGPREHAARVPPFRSADGVRFEIETFDAENWLRFWTTLGVERAAIAAGWPPFQQRFATATCALPAVLGTTTESLAYRRVRAAGAASGVSILPVRTADADLPVPASPWRLRALQRDKSAVRAVDAAQPGELRDKVDAALGPPRGQAESVPLAGPRDKVDGAACPPLGPGESAPLAGLRLLESTNRVQGPLAGHVLGLLGADVVRLEPPGGDPLRGVPPMAGDCSARFLALNRGKSAVEADLKTEAGRRTALRLAASADVFLHNWPPGRAERFGLDHRCLAAVRPSLVYAQAGGWAEALPAPQPLGTDYLVQAYTGVAALLSEPPTPTLMTITDVLGALINAEGVVAALLARARTGIGVHVETALVDAAHLIRATAAERAAATPDAAVVVTDLAAMAADPAYAAAFDGDGAAAYSRAPWTFTQPAVHHRQEVAFS